MDVAELESRRFGRAVARFDLDDLDDDAVRRVGNSGADLAIIRIDARHIDHVHRLGVLGADVLVADTLVYYGAPFRAAAGKPVATALPFANNALSFRLGRPNDRDEFAALIASTFDGYKNHYTSNPLIGRADILDGYTEWGLSFLDPDRGDLWVAEEAGRIVGFAGCRAHDGDYEIVLNGVLPAASGRHVYGDIVSHVITHAATTSAERVTVSTQIDNLAVQRAWTTRGLRLERALNTVHVNLHRSDRHPAAVHHDVPNPAPAAGSVWTSVLAPVSDAALAELLAGTDVRLLTATSSYAADPPEGPILEVTAVLKHHEPTHGHTVAVATLTDGAGRVVHRRTAVFVPSQPPEQP